MLQLWLVDQADNLRGYLLDNSCLAALEAALCSVGAAPMNGVERRLVPRPLRLISSRPPPPGDRTATLTAKQRQVLELLCTGASYREVATVLNIAQGTMQSHVKSLYAKLGVCSKAEAVRVAMESVGAR